MRLKTKELILFSLLGATMFASKVLTDFLPNIHLIGLFTVTFTLVFRAKALFPISVFIFLTGLYGGFSFWWLAYFYTWPLLWLAVMLLPKNMPKRVATPVYMLVSGLHGLLYGTLSAPIHALFLKFDFKTTVAWIISGIPFDITHGISNFIVASLTLPLVNILKRCQQSIKQ